MLSKKLKQIATEIGFKIADNIAYGVKDGYMITLSEADDMRYISISGAITDEAAARLEEKVKNRQFAKTYGSNFYELERESLTINYPKSLFIPKGFNKLLTDITVIARECGVIGDGFCTACGNYINAGDEHNIALINGVVHRIHSSCAGAVNERSVIENDIYKNEKKNLASGTVGAILGAMVGGILWAVAYYFGWFIALIGAAIGFCSKKGYELLGGKSCKAKMVILVIATVFGAAFGQVLGDFVSLAVSGAEYGYTLLDVPALYLYILGEDPEVLSATLSNFAQGTLFAILGVIIIVQKTNREHKKATLKSTILE